MTIQHVPVSLLSRIYAFAPLPAFSVRRFCDANSSFLPPFYLLLLQPPFSEWHPGGGKKAGRGDGNLSRPERHKKARETAFFFSLPPSAQELCNQE